MCASLVTFAAFIIRSQIDGSKPLSTAQAFTSLAIISLITSPALQLLASIPALTASMAAFDRVHKFLTCSTSDREVDQKSSTPLFQDSSVLPAPDEKGDGQAFTSDITMETIRVEGNPFSASPKPSNMAMLTVSEVYIRPNPTSQFRLQNINVTIKPGKITIITGPVGCGKSILLKAVMGDVICEQGYISVYDDKGIAYCSQIPWLQNTTIRNNICGYSGRNNLNWYHEVLHACALEDDLASLSNGDESLVGSQGITLSGGQKQRIALARALFSRQQLLVLDSVLSAVDQHTEQIILERVFGSKGLCRNAGISVLMTTHSSKSHFYVVDQVLESYICTRT
jgi:ABC-type multidrug transport system fused ATPase/permease subunit